MFALALILAQTPIPISAEGWKQDLGLMKRGLTVLHAGLNRYLTPEQFEKEWKVLENVKPRSRGEAYLAIAQLLTKIKCGHSYPNFFNQPDEVQKELFEKRDKLPFTFRWINGVMVVTNPMQSGLARGSEITRVNGIPTKEILRNLMTVARADGSNDAKRVAYLEATGAGGYEAFDVYYPLFYPVGNKAFDLELRQAPRQVQVAPISLEERQISKAATSNAPAFSDRMIRPDVAVLDMPGWALYNSKWDWRAYLKDFFTRVTKDKVPNLIIDIRANEGGIEIGKTILSYLTEQPFSPAPFEAFTRYRRVPDDLKPYLSTWDRSFQDWGTQATEVGPYRYLLKRGFDDSQTPIKPAAIRYPGRVFVLMGPTNSSATFQFLADVEQTKLATTVGQPSGGNRRGINGGAFFFMSLPNSKIEFDIPLIAYIPKAPQRDEGIKPNVFVRPTAAAVAQGRDLEMEAALRLCDQK